MDSVDISVSFIDIIADLEDGVGLILSFKVKDVVYEMIYWFDATDGYRLIVSDDFLKDYGVSSVYDYKNIKQLVAYIDSNIPNKRDIVEKYILNK